jgi:hypothetical protein
MAGNVDDLHAVYRITDILAPYSEPSAFTGIVESPEVPEQPPVRRSEPEGSIAAEVQQTEARPSGDLIDWHGILLYPEEVEAFRRRSQGAGR